MLFTEPTFLFAFLPLLLAIYYVTPLAARNALLVVASVLFYARDGGAFTWLILASIVVNTVAAVWVDRLRGTPAATRLLVGIVGLNLLSLATFKYSGFLIENLNLALGAMGMGPLAAPELLLPIGISFFTFHSISYIVDVYRRQAVAQKGPVGAALYLLFFPQLIAGPIIRYKDIAAQINARPHTSSGFALGVRRFIIGLAKKLLVAGIVARPADAIFALPPGELTAALAWLGVACYTLQIYFDFSGYSDMAIGLGHMFGFTFPENFRYPYVASSVQDFWKRWHMSLSSWFRDYLYIPLGGSRVSPARVYLNLTHRVLPVRVVARRKLDFRHLGPAARAVPRARTPGPGTLAVQRPARGGLGLHAAGGDGGLGVLPRGLGLARVGNADGDGGPGRGSSDALRRVLVPDAGVAAGGAGGHHRLHAGRAGAGAVRHQSPRRRWRSRRRRGDVRAMGARYGRGACRDAAGIDDAGGRRRLQPLHLLPLLICVP